MTGIYKIINPCNKIYIGQSTNIFNRVNHYKKLDCKGQPKLYNSIKKYGWENHVFEIIEECNIEQLNDKEIYWGQYFDVLNPDKGLNIKNLGYGGSHSTETKEKISLSLKGRDTSSFSKEHYTDEWRNKISISNLGKKRSEETKQKMSKSALGHSRNKGRIQSDEEKKKRSLVRQGYNPTKEHINSMRASMLGKNTTPVICINSQKIYSSIREAANLLNLNERAIQNHLSGLTKSLKNKLQFKYLTPLNI
jgi:group I intron endonuclease